MTQEEIFKVLDEVVEQPRYKKLTDKDRKAAIGKLAEETELGQWPGDEQRIQDIQQTKTHPQLQEKIHERQDLHGQVLKAREGEARQKEADRAAEPSLRDRATGIAKSVLDKIFPTPTATVQTPAPAPEPAGGAIPTKLAPSVTPPTVAPTRPASVTPSPMPYKPLDLGPSGTGTKPKPESPKILTPKREPTPGMRDYMKLQELENAAPRADGSNGEQQPVPGTTPEAKSKPLPRTGIGVKPITQQTRPTGLPPSAEEQARFEERLGRNPQLDAALEQAAVKSEIGQFDAQRKALDDLNAKLRKSSARVNDLQDEYDDLVKQFEAMPQEVHGPEDLEAVNQAQAQLEEKRLAYNKAIDEHNALLAESQKQTDALNEKVGPINERLKTIPPVTLHKYEDFEPLTYGGAWKNFANNLIKGGVQFGEGTLKWIGIAARDLDEIMGRVPPGTDPKEYFTFQLGEKVKELAEKQFPTRPDLQKNFLLTTLPQALGSSAAFLLAGVGGAAAKAPVYLAPGMAGAMVTGAQQYEDAKKYKADEEKSRMAFYMGSAIGVSEALPVENLLQRLAKLPGGSNLREAVKQGAEQAVVEALQEMFQQGASNLVAKWLYDQNRRLGEEVIENGGAGGLTGFLTGFLLAGSARARSQGLEGMGTSPAYPAPGGPQTQPPVGQVPAEGPPGPPPPATQPVLPPVQPVEAVAPPQGKPLAPKAPVKKPVKKPAQAATPEAIPAPSAQVPVPAPIEVPGAVMEEKPVEAPVDTGKPAEVQASDVIPGPKQAEPSTEAAPPSVPVEKPEVTPVDQAAAEAHPEPTEGQKEAGNYKKGHVTVSGLDISIENPQGSERSGTGKDGKPWSITMQDHYGYIKGTTGKDKDHLDVFIKPGTPEDYDGPVFVINQNNEKGHFDEHKIILGAATPEEAREIYSRNYSTDWQGLGSIRGFTMPEFKEWLKSGDHTKPVKEPERVLPIEEPAAKTPDQLPGKAETKPPAGETIPGPPETKPAESETAPPDKITQGSNKLAGIIKNHLMQPGSKPFDKNQLWAWADEAFGGTKADGTYTPKDAYDAVELGVNQFLLERAISLDKNPEEAAGTIDAIRRDIMDKLPVMGRYRTEEQEEMQQFSTPPDLSYAMNWTAAIKPSDVVLEPSAGVGGLAVYGQAIGATVHANEITDRRAALLNLLGLRNVTRENAEQIHNILPKDIQPTVIIMNPPFSSTVRRPGQRSTENVTLHLGQAMKRLREGGRLVALVGKNKFGKPEPAVERWLTDQRKRYTLQAQIGLSGKLYKKYGTEYDNQLLILDKVPPKEGHVPVVKEVLDVKDALAALARVRVERPVIAPASHPEPVPGVPGPREGTARPQSGSALPTDVVGTGQGTHGGKPGVSATTPVEPGVPGVSGGRPERSPGVPAGESGGSKKPAGTQPQSAAAAAGEKPAGGEPASAEHAGQQNVGDRGGVAASVPEGGGLNLERPTEQKHEGELSDSPYDEYKPKKVKIKGAQPHPAVLVESAAMAAVEAPDPSYTPNLDPKTIANGDLSEAQLETPVYAGMAHEQFLPNGDRMGFFNGDGTGVGKGRQIASIIMDNWRRGRKKAVWISEKEDLLKDAIRDWTGIGGSEKDLQILNKWALKEKVSAKDAVMFVTYDTLKSGLELTPAGKLQNKGTTPKPGQTATPEPSRLEQLIQWLGPDYEGVIVFDEAHNMGNSISLEEEGDFRKGGKQPAMKALAGVELQKKLPKARVAYFSATGATNPENLAYLDRLGLWGKGTPFPDKADFINKIKSQGLAAMELVAQELKARGLYMSRSISYHDVTFSDIEHALTPDQKVMYDTVARVWQVILRNVEAALALTGGEKSRAKGAAKGRLWSTQQRTFNFILTSFQMPSVLEQMKKDLGAGKAAVLQLTNTNDAQAQEAIGRRKASAAQGEDVDLDGLDITPKAAMIEFLRNAFPVQQYEETEDDNGNVIMVPVKDSQGNAVLNEEAVRMRDDLIRDVELTVNISEGPLEAVLNTFGPERVAEITGRKSRLYRHPESGKMVEEKRGEAAIEVDRKAFNDGRKDILIFSEKGGTGKSYHADLKIKNQKKRMHYLVQAGWRADKAVQGFGRTHRSNQKGPPHYYLCKTNLKGHKRFISTIARRLEQLGSLTRGQRQTGSSGLINANDNLENEYALGAVHQLIELSFRGQLPNIPYKPIIEERMGLDLIDRKSNAINKTKLPDVPKFLNRILNLELEEQNLVFEEFDRRRQAAVEAAAAKGLLDTGTETVKAQSVKKVNEQVVYQDKAHNAETKLVQLELRHKAYLMPAAELEKSQGFIGYAKNKKSGHLYGMVKAGLKTLENGSLVTLYKRFTVVEGEYDYNEYKNDDEMKQHYDVLPLKEGRHAWDDARALHPGFRTEKMNLLVGTMLRIWDRLPQNFIKVKRVQTDEGQRFLGRQITNNELGPLLERLGAEVKAPKLTGQEAMDAILKDGASIILANGWKMERRTVANEKRVELSPGKGPALGPHSKELRTDGVQIEKVGYDYRYFIPNAGIFERLVQFRPIARLIEAASDERGSMPANPFARPAPEAVVGAQTDDGKYHSVDPEVEARYQAATKGIGKVSLFEKLKAYWDEFKRKSTSEFEFLPDTVEFSPLRNALLRLQKQKSISADLMLREMKDVMGHLSDPKLDLFTRKVILMDLTEEAQAGHALPYGYTEDTLQQDLEAVDHLLTLNPDVQEAWDRRQSMWATLKNRYIQSMDAIGFDVTQKVKKDNYFRHQVLAYAQEMGNRAATAGTGKRLRTPTGRSFLKRREGSTYDINANYVQAEFEVLAQMHYDIHLADVIKLIDDTYNLQPQLVEQARRKNEKAFKQKLAEEGLVGPLNTQWLQIRQRLGMHMNRLRQALGLNEDDLVSIEEIQRMASDPTHLGHQSALGVFKWINRRRQLIKDTLGDAFVTWEDMIPEGYDTFQPREGNIFYMADTLPQQMVQQLQEQMGQAMGITPEMLRQVLAMGAKREQFVVPEEVAATLTNMQKPEYSTAQKAWAEIQASWKAGKLVGPHSMFKYNLRNLTGDAEATFVGNPQAFKRVPDAITDLAPLFFKEGRLEGHVKDWFERGGMGTLLQVNEMGDLNDLTIFRGMAERARAGGPASKAWSLMNHYWQAARLSTDFREAILRYANYREYLDQIDQAGRPKNYGASIPGTVDALDDPKDKAFKLSNELIGAYDRISVTGQQLRRYWWPFWSWKEVNFVRYKQLIKNAFHEKNYGTAGRVVVGRVAVTGVQSARLLLKLGFMYGMLQIWNHLFFPDEERELNERTRNRVHIIFGRTADDKIMYLDGIGALGDLLSWVGLDSAASHLIAGDILHDRMTLRELAIEMLKSPFNIVAQGLGPVPIKLPAEVFAGKTAYPDVFNPAPIRDLPQHLANQATPFGPEIAAARGKPGKPYLSPESLRDTFVQTQDPGQAAYYNWQQIEDKWRARMGKPSNSGYQRSERGQALSDWAAAIRFGDTTAEQKYKQKFQGEGGTTKHIKASLRNLAPLAGLNRDEKAYLLGNLDNQEKAALKAAEKYYVEHMLKLLPMHERADLMASLIEHGGLSSSIVPRKSLPGKQPSAPLP